MKGLSENSVGRAAGRTTAGGHALVIGGSLAGMLAARVLSDTYERVTVVERDRYPAGAAARRGVPQASHLHGLMLRGQLILERLFPGLGSELVAAGAIPVDLAAETAWLTPSGWAARFTSDLAVLSFTRPLLDHHVRQRMAAIPHVSFLEGADVLGLLPGRTRQTVAGVLLGRRGGDAAHGDGEETLAADLVVDASGRGSRAPRWLEQLGYHAPEERVVNSFLGYASRLYRIPANFSAGWKGAYVQAQPPTDKRAGILLPVEGGRWLLTLGGRGRDYPPTDDAGFLDFARSLRSTVIYDAIKDAEPLTPAASFRANENRLRRYERLTAQPHNFIVTGDAACAFNPVYGQGMTTAALGALALDECVRAERKRRGGPAGPTDGFAARFQRRLARVVAGPWMMATSEDCRYPDTVGGETGPATRFMHSYMDAVTRLSTEDASVRRLLLENIHMLKRPTSLFAPGVVLGVVRHALGRAPAPAACARAAVAPDFSV